ncbi:MAG TPA: 2Fe-2S iron-sulfur cluster-binding protein [Chloroflexia bacterium]|nr:2Fe-2S iron-sulfur cluster-binding protein [Chloroflexia bacterium]
MPRITVDGEKSFDVPNGTRLVRAIEENGIDILHRCGGFAKCTTCRVEFRAGEPDRMTEAEYNKLSDKGLFQQVRLSCQILCDHDMSVNVVNRLHTSGLPDPGPEPEATITPDPVWMDKPAEPRLIEQPTNSISA